MLTNRLTQRIVARASFIHKQVAHHTSFPCGCSNPALTTMVDQLCNEAIPRFSAPRAASETSASDTPKIFQTSGKQSVIRTMTGGDATATAEAMGISGKKIVAVGKLSAVEAEMAKLFPSQSIPRQELKDNECLVPGMIEPHVHVLMSALMMSWKDYTPWDATGLQMKEKYDFDSLKELLTQDVANVIGNFWLLGNGVDPSLLIREPYPEDMLGLITRDYLDDISKIVPMLLLAASGHTVYVNTIALQKIWEHAKETGNTSFLERHPTVDEYIANTNGVLNELEEELPAIEAVPPEQLDVLKQEAPANLVEFMETARQRGVTMMYDAGSSPAMQSALESMSDHYPIHLGIAFMCNSMNDFTNFTQDKEWAKPTEDTLGCFVSAIKLVSDGSNQGITGFQSEQYENAATYGLFNFGNVGTGKPPAKAPKEFTELVCAISSGGWQTMIHANGDQANRYTLQAYEEARNQVGALKFEDFRNRIEHCSLLWDADVAKIKELGVSPSFLIGHVGFWGYVFDTYIFGKKGERLDLLQTMVQEGVPFTCHSDSAVTPPGPLRMMEQAVTRKMEWSPQARNGLAATEIPVLVESERVSPAEALKALTYDAAWQCHAEDLVGSLEKGKLADFVLLDRDPLGMTATDAYKNMRFIEVKESWIEGSVKSYSGTLKSYA